MKTRSNGKKENDMRGSSRKRWWSLGVLLLFLAPLTACDEDPTEPSGVPEELGQLEPGIHPVLAVSDLPQAEDGRPGDAGIRPEGPELAAITIRIRLQQVRLDGQVASYQGELTYDVERMELLDGTVPDGIVGAFHEPETGRIRFAGASVEGIASDAEVLVVRFRPTGSVDQSAFSLEMEEVTAAGDLRDMTTKVVNRKVPLLVKAGMP